MSQNPCRDSGHIDYPMAQERKSPPAPANKGKRYPAEILTEDEARRLLAACSKRAPTGIRNRALIIVLYRAGIRISEALALYPRDLDAEAGTIHVREEKGSKPRAVSLQPGGVRRARPLARREGAPRPRRETPSVLDPSRSAVEGELHPRALLPRLAEKAGIEKRVHAHALRHAAELAREGTPTNLIQAQLGH